MNQPLEQLGYEGVHDKTYTKSVYKEFESIAGVARNLGVHVTTLRDWIRSSEAVPEDSVSMPSSETLLIAQLRKGWRRNHGT